MLFPMVIPCQSVFRMTTASGDQGLSDLILKLFCNQLSLESGVLFAKVALGLLWSSGCISLSGLIVFLVMIHFLKKAFLGLVSQDDTCVASGVRLLLRDEQALRDFLKFWGSEHLAHQLESLESNNVLWMNNLLTKIWPFINRILEEVIEAKGFSNRGHGIPIELQGRLTVFSSTIFVNRLTLGDKPPVISGIKVLPNPKNREVREGRPHRTKKRANDIIIECKLSYYGNCVTTIGRRTLNLFEVKAGIKDIYLQSKAQLRLHPLLKEIPFVGGVSITLTEAPVIQFDMMHLASVVNKELLENVIQAVVKNLMVFPNCMSIPFSKNKDIVRRVVLNEPIGLCAVHLSFSGSPASKLGWSPWTPHAVVRIGSCFFTTDLSDKTFSCSGPILSLNDIFSIRVHDSEEDALSTEKPALTYKEVPFHVLVTEWSPSSRDVKLEVVKEGVTHVLLVFINCKQLLPKRVSGSRIPRPAYLPIGLFYVFIHDIFCLPSILLMENTTPFILVKFGEVSFTTNLFDPKHQNPIPIHDGTYFRFYEETPSKLLHVLVINGSKVGKKTSEKPHHVFNNRQVIAHRTLDLKRVLKSNPCSLEETVHLYRQNDQRFRVNINIQFFFSQD